MVRQWTDKRFAEKADSAFDKIQAVLPASLQGELERITTYSISNQSALPWSVSFSDLRDCIRIRRKIRIAYIDESQRDSLRTLRPLALIFCSPVWLLAAWCEKRKDFRNFRLDRIQTIELCEDTFEDEKDKNLSAYKVQDAIC
ncbi:MAG: WYL domain-containing protein [Rhodobacteraceae bacterium]|nr:WYL domain-containing protein [Paracoccaceae bacterium]